MRFLAALTLLTACADPAPPGHGEAWPEANALFHRDARMIGADGAYTIDLGGPPGAERILWLYGDTFVARNHDDPHDGSAFLRNTVSIQTGRDPETATMRFYWRHHSADPNDLGSFLPEPTAETWLWPGAGIRLDDTLVIFCGRLFNDGPPSPTSFADEGWDARIVRNPDDEPDAWILEQATLPPDGGVGDEALGEAVIVDDSPTGDPTKVLVYGTRGDAHAITLTRFDRAAMVAGDLSEPERMGELFSPGAPESSVLHDTSRGRDRWVWIASGGYGSTNIVWRVAPHPEGPWSDPTDLWRPPESFYEGAFTYAGKAHPELATGDGAYAGSIAVTYVPSGFDDFPEALNGIYYFPLFARVWLE